PGAGHRFGAKCSGTDCHRFLSSVLVLILSFAISRFPRRSQERRSGGLMAGIYLAATAILYRQSVDYTAGILWARHRGDGSGFALLWHLLHARRGAATIVFRGRARRRAQLCRNRGSPKIALAAMARGVAQNRCAELVRIYCSGPKMILLQINEQRRFSS